jgi:muconolactone delta-isomerase
MRATTLKTLPRRQRGRRLHLWRILIACVVLYAVVSIYALSRNGEKRRTMTTTMRRAWVTISDTDGYAEGAMTLAKSLRAA